MARRCRQVNTDQRRVLCERLEGMNLANRGTEEMRTSVAKKTGLTLKSVNVNLHDRLPAVVVMLDYTVTVLFAAEATIVLASI